MTCDSSVPNPTMLLRTLLWAPRLVIWPGLRLSGVLDSKVEQQGIVDFLLIASTVLIVTGTVGLSSCRVRLCAAKLNVLAVQLVIFMMWKV